MNTLLNKAASAISGTVLFCIGCVMAGLGLTVVALLALFAMAVTALALIAAPFVGWIAPQDETARPAPDAEVAA